MSPACGRSASTTRRSSRSTSTRTRRARSGSTSADINQTLSTAWGGTLRQRLHRPRPGQAGLRPGRRALSRMQPEDISDLVRAQQRRASMVPFSAFSTAHWTNAPVQLSRFNGLPSLEIQGPPAPGVSSGKAMKAMEELAAKLPPGIGLDWTGLSYQEQLSERPGAAALRPVAADRLPVPRRAVRELVDPGRGAAGRAARHRRRGVRGHAARPRERRLFPGRPAHDHGSRGQERDPDRRVRRGTAARRARAASTPRSRRRGSGCGRS